ncbi:hypothetical protein H1R20_g5245, partial [Candolleomyces eurysporus]
MIFSHLVSLLEGASNFHEAQCRSSRKRKRALEADKSKKRSKANEDSAMEVSSGEDGVLEVSQDPCSALPLPPKPPILDHLVCGINAVTKRLEAQARQVRRSVIISSKPLDELEAALPISLVFVCRADVDPPILINHLPQLVAACNSVPSKAPVKIIPLPKESEGILAEKLGIRRASVLALDAQYPGIPEFSTRLESVTAPAAPWLMLQAKNTTTQLYEPTHVKQLRTSAPKDMKAAKESRLQVLKFSGSQHPLCFSSPKDLLQFVTSNWKENFVTCDLDSKELVDVLIRRPFFLLLSVDAPLMNRFMRSQNFQPTSLEQFVTDNDRLTYGPASLYELQDLVNVRVVNAFQTVEKLHSHLESLDLVNTEHLRPSWDAYFMTLASLASRRSNCMKRRVGAVIVRDNRVISTGYNGTPRGLVNCNEGGCSHCNGVFPSMSLPIECLCLHAEENALLEAGRERVGSNAVLYCNTCPCLKCTVKIIQTGIKTVVYNLAYKMDTASATLFQQSNVELRRYDPHNSFRLPPVNDELGSSGS